MRGLFDRERLKLWAVASLLFKFLLFLFLFFFFGGEGVRSNGRLSEKSTSGGGDGVKFKSGRLSDQVSLW